MARERETENTILMTNITTLIVHSSIFFMWKTFLHAIKFPAKYVFVTIINGKQLNLNK